MDFNKSWVSQQAQPSDAENGVEDINHVAWPVGYTALNRVLRVINSVFKVCTQYLPGNEE
jgi:hypothetical protein